jgi:hypothetical protein
MSKKVPLQFQRSESFPAELRLDATGSCRRLSIDLHLDTYDIHKSSWAFRYNILLGYWYLSMSHDPSSSAAIGDKKTWCWAAGGTRSVLQYTCHNSLERFYHIFAIYLTFVFGYQIAGSAKMLSVGEGSVIILTLAVQRSLGAIVVLMTVKYS